MRRVICRAALLYVCSLLAFTATAHAQDFSLTSSTYLGGESDDAVLGARIQANGAILVAGRLSAVPEGTQEILVGDATSSSNGVVLRVSPDGRTAVSATRVASVLVDLALDSDGRLYLAAGDDGLIVLDPLAEQILWQDSDIGYAYRVDAAPDGTVAVLVPDNVGDADTKAGTGTIHVYDSSGVKQSEFSGHRSTQDICVDGASQTLGLIGWRQANAFDGNTTNPVQIAYLRGMTYEGDVKWTGYDWSTDREADDFINRPENNMADTRGYRCAIGADGKLYAAYESAGGNHIFRYSPFDITSKVTIVGGDEYHEWYNSRSEHKLFFARYEPSDGTYLLGQQFAGRISSGRTNTVRAKSGEIAADAAGRVLVTSESAASLPIADDDMYPGTGEYKGGAYLLVMSADFTQRLWLNRVSPNATGHAVDIRAFEDGRPNVVYAGTTETDSEMYVLDGLQDSFGGGNSDGFFAVLNGVVPEDWDPGSAPPPEDTSSSMDQAEMSSTDDIASPDASDQSGSNDGESALDGNQQDGGSGDGCGCQVRASDSSDRRHIANGVLLLLGLCLVARVRFRRSAR